jgi:hypothetical protein
LLDAAYALNQFAAGARLSERVAGSLALELDR